MKLVEFKQKLLNTASTFYKKKFACLTSKSRRLVF